MLGPGVGESAQEPFRAITCAPETNTILLLNCTSIRKKKKKKSHYSVDHSPRALMGVKLKVQSKMFWEHVSQVPVLKVGGLMWGMNTSLLREKLRV